MHEYLPRAPPAEPIQLAKSPESRAFLLTLNLLLDLLDRGRGGVGTARRTGGPSLHQEKAMPS
jgi:hypothetical protein